jgi:hypothetical protein
MPRKPSTEPTPRTTSHTKRPYVRPVLKRYGDLAQLTKAKGRSGQNSDGAIANNNKTV